MAACISCNTALPEGAAFCSACGSTQTTAVRGPLIDPAARRAATIASASARGFIAEIGVDRALCILGGILGALGAVLPYFTYAFPTGSLPTPIGGGVPLIALGIPGVLVLLLALFLAGSSVLLRPSRALALAGVGLSAIVLAKLFGDWFTFALFQAAIQAASSLSPAYARSFTDGLHAGAGAGFFCLFLGFALLFYTSDRHAAANR